MNAFPTFVRSFILKVIGVIFGHNYYYRCMKNRFEINRHLKNNISQFYFRFCFFGNDNNLHGGFNKHSKPFSELKKVFYFKKFKVISKKILGFSACNQ